VSKTFSSSNNRLQALNVKIGQNYAAYTVGHSRVGLPEVVILGDDKDAIVERLNDISSALLTGPLPIVPGYVIRSIPTEDAMSIAPVPFEIYGIDRVRFVQAIYPDAKGLFPWDRRVDKDASSIQVDYWGAHPRPSSEQKETLESIVRAALKMVAAGDVAIIPDSSGGYGYTIGHAARGFPELLMCEIEPGDTSLLLGPIGNAFLEGKLKQLGNFKTKSISEEKANRLAPLAHILFPSLDVKVSQIVFPDLNGKFPWDKGVMPELKEMQQHYWE
jgi:hypothetical protein